jgi:hypothetical protein
MIAAALLRARSEPASSHLLRPMAIGRHSVFDPVVVRGQLAVVDVARQSAPRPEAFRSRTRQLHWQAS